MLVEYSLQGFAIVQNSRIVFCNKSFAEILGYSVEELLSSSDLKEIIHPEDRSLVVDRHHKRLTGDPVPERYEHRMIKKDGSECWVQIHAKLSEYDGKPAIQLVQLDILNKSRLKKLFEKAKNSSD